MAIELGTCRYIGFTLLEDGHRGNLRLHARQHLAGDIEPRKYHWPACVAPRGREQLRSAPHTS